MKKFIWAIVGVLLALPAIAAPPEIFADRNPVVFYVSSASFTKTTTITWNAGAGHNPASVYYRVNGRGADIPFAQGKNGAKDATFIKLDNEYEFCLWGTNKTEKLSCVTVTTKKVDVKLHLSFIDNIEPEPHGMSAKIKFTTDSSSLPVVMVSNKPPAPFPPASKQDVQVFNQNDLISSNFAQTGTVHEAILTDLQPDTEFHYVISAFDKSSGYWWKVKGKFRTLRRSVNVTFEKIKVVDDSDDLSDGDLLFGFFVNGKNAPNGSPLTVGAHLGTSESKTINISASLLNVPASLQLKAIGYDDDEDEIIPYGIFIIIPLSTCGSGNVTDASETEGENDCGEWSSDDDGFDIGPNTSGVNDPENFTKSFTLKAYPKGDDSEVSFDVTGTYSVSYVQ
jgi:hypothetical protein